MLAPLRDVRADYSLILEMYGSTNFFLCQGAFGIAESNFLWDIKLEQLLEAFILAIVYTIVVQ